MLSSDRVPDERFRSLSARSAFWLSSGLLFMICALWALSSPVMSSPDEPAHAIKAAAVVRGQLLGDQDGMAVGRGIVEVPALFRTGDVLPQCFLGEIADPSPDAPQPAVDLQCYQAYRGDAAATTTAMTSAVRYNPLYYAFAGLPSLLPLSTATFYLMRLVGALLAAGLFGSTVRTLAELGRSHWLLTALAVGVTPMAVFLCGSINPQSVELPAAALVWVTLLSLLRSPDPVLHTRRLLRLTLGVVFLANVRGLGPVMLAAIVFLVVAATPWRASSALLRNPRSWPWLIACVLATGTGVWWTAATGTISTVGAVAYPEFTGAAIIRRTLATTDYYIRQSIGIFGWLDTFQPGWVYLMSAGLILMTVILGFAAGSGRERFALSAAAAGVILLPVYAQYAQSSHIGLFWQGRYGLPVALGVPLLAGFALRSQRNPLPDWWSRRVTATVLAGVVVVQTCAIGVNMRRYISGVGEDVPWFGYGPHAWLPPVPPWLILAGSFASWSGLAVVLVRAANRAHHVGAGDGDGQRGESTWVVPPAVRAERPRVADPG